MFHLIELISFTSAMIDRAPIITVTKMKAQFFVEGKRKDRKQLQLPLLRTTQPETLFS